MPVSVKPFEAFVIGMEVGLGLCVDVFDCMVIFLAFDLPHWDAEGIGYGIPCNPLARRWTILPIKLEKDKSSLRDRGQWWDGSFSLPNPSAHLSPRRKLQRAYFQIVTGSL